MADKRKTSSKKKSKVEKAEKSEGKRVNWPHARFNKLLDLLFIKRAAIGEGGNFKTSVYNEAAAELNKMVPEGGVLYDGNSVKNKWTKERTKQAAVAAIKKRSGWTYTEQHGAGITPDMLPAFEAFCKEVKAAKEFKSKGYPYYDKMCAIAPAKVSGKNVFNAGASDEEAPGSNNPSRSPSPSRHSRTPMTPGPSTAKAASQAINVDSDSDADDEGELPTVPSPKSKRKAAEAKEAPSKKRSRTSVADTAISFMAKSTNEMSRMNDLLETVFVKDAEGHALQASPSHRTQATDRCQDLEADWLTAKQLLALVKVFQNGSVSAADTYLSLKVESLRKDWVMDTLMAVAPEVL